MKKPYMQGIKKYFIIVPLLVASVFAISQVSLYQDARDNILYLRQVFLKISDKYVERVNMPHLIDVAIKAMVNELDPYTEYIEKDAKRRVQMITEGTYGGLGMEIGMRNGKVTIIAPIEDTPAERAGIHAGDVLIKIDSKSVNNLSLDEVSKRLRGKIGTDVVLEIERLGIDELISKKLTRDKIVIKDVQYYSFVKPGIAYIKLSGFTEKAPAEFISAIKKLRQKGKIEAFLLDLRSNPGGLLASAVKISNVFLPKGKLVVSTKGIHEGEKKYNTLSVPILPDIPLVVLVDNGSASASEIVTGAIKDLDRGVVVGDTTYGKGLVQKLIPIDDTGNIQLKMTTAKYFTPSGRCIQRDNYKLKHKTTFMISNNDSLLKKEKFKTENGRSVYSGGGIIPDVTIQNKKIALSVLYLWRKNVLFDFVVQYLSLHPEFKLTSDYIISEEMLEKFNTFRKKKNSKYISQEQVSLKKTIKKFEKREDLKNAALVLKEQLKQIISKDSLSINKFENDLKWAIKIELASQLEQKEIKLNTILDRDEQYIRALQLLTDQEKYLETLARN